MITAVAVDSFKNRLDKIWANKEARFDYKTNISAEFLQDASKSYVAFVIMQCKMRAQRHVYVHV